MRRLDFKMERTGLIQVGDVVELREELLASMDYYYVIEPAVAMSENIKFGDRLTAKTGTVVDIKETDRGFYVTLEVEG